MTIIEVVLTSIGLASDAFAVAICKGLSLKESSTKISITIGIYFGIFQTIMPIIGYLLASTFYSHIVNIDHYVTFFLLSVIGINMIKESNTCEEENDKINFKTMIPLAIATSIDALAVGVTLTFLKVNIISSSVIIGIITFMLSFLGVKIGNKFGFKLKNKSQIFGGIILITIGLKILIEHIYFM